MGQEEHSGARWSLSPRQERGKGEENKKGKIKWILEDIYSDI